MNFFKRSIVIFTIFLFFSANGVFSWFDSDEILQENVQKKINALEESIKQITAEEMSQIRGEISSISETLTLALCEIKTSIQEKITECNEILQENNQKRINALEESIKQITAEEMSQIRGEISSISETLTLALSGIKTSIQEKSKSFNESYKLLVYAIVSTWVISIIFVLKKCFNCINCSQDLRRIDVPSYQFQLPYHDNRGRRLYRTVVSNSHSNCSSRSSSRESVKSRRFDDDYITLEDDLDNQIKGDGEEEEGADEEKVGEGGGKKTNDG
uniref:Uncharacterized protein n=1 Tax=Strongyloides venezuelensis TaxID=75913 RepID=A0A0K0FP89_STRVS